jgi:SAM-dependent methyltransferase
MTTQNYADIFAQRGGDYDQAMRLHPRARDEEFGAVVGRAGLVPGMAVIDVPAGGGYLAQHLPASCHWLGHEPCRSFADAGDSRATPLLPLPWPDAAADAAISLAGVHHLDDKRALFAELARVTKPGAIFVLADVHADAAVARFLDDFVGAHNSTGHAGSYLGPQTADELRACGWQVQSAERVPFHWRFDDRAAMGRFCHLMFDLRSATPEDTARAAEATLGVDVLPTGVGLRWELYCVVAVNARHAPHPRARAST